MTAGRCGIDFGRWRRRPGGESRLLPGSRLVTLRAFVHAPYQASYGNACVDDRVNGYLATGVPPARDVTCGAYVTCDA
ncbi:alpha/beta hydrolase [Spirillospora sp. NPDC047279]|uniref:alpha/beta hydrolase n=1 Tax=Spirillospora sp. NPDC047279 TaxID=3155478 RepID=UPI0033DF39AC